MKNITLDSFHKFINDEEVNILIIYNKQDSPQLANVLVELKKSFQEVGFGVVNPAESPVLAKHLQYVRSPTLMCFQNGCVKLILRSDLSVESARKLLVFLLR